MVSVEEAVVSRLIVKDKKFEVLVDPNKALEIKRGKAIDISEALAYPEVYRDVRKALRASEEELLQVFGTRDVFKIAEKIIKQGKLQLTTEQRRKFIQEKKMQIANIISRQGINPQTGASHPPQRILAVMEEAGVSVDPFMDAELQVESVLKSIKSLIPIKFQKYTIQLRIPASYVWKVQSILKSSSTIISQEWLSDGGLKVVIKIPAGIQGELFSKIAKVTHGNFESSIIKREDVE
ncbi:MAG TPA: ribosome assembly factor SBDS [Candidatus Aenigmarchaeota archaeon]|nr:ribosome assembly factor SBDS [Candidatus Aenigmarchaeota archaeon]